MISIPPCGKRPRLLVVGNGPTARSPGGDYQIERYVDEFLLQVADQGCTVSFLQGIQDHVVNANFFGGAVPKDKVEIIGAQQGRVGSWLANSPRIISRLLQADFVYLFYPGSHSRRIAQLCRLVGKPYGLYLRGARVIGDGALLRDARLLLSVAPALFEDIEDTHADTGLIRPMCGLTPADAFHREFPPLRDRPLRLLFVGRIAQDKGVVELVEATDRLRAAGIPFVLTIIGGGPMYDQLARRFADPGLRVRVLGVVADRQQVTAEYEQSDVFILPTYGEGFPRVLYEAMIKSVPIVTTMVGGIPDLMKSGENCLAIPLNDPAAVAAAIMNIGQDRALASRLARNGMATVIQVLETRQPHAEALYTRLRIAPLGKL